MIRLATTEDAAAVAAIYAPYVAETNISFEIVPPTGEEISTRMTGVLQRLPWLVYEEEEEGRILGYAYASPHRTREAYQWSVDVAVYVDAGAHRRGIGRALYEALFPMLRALGYVNAYAGITLPNPKSVGLHEALGFRPVGVYTNVGFKLGQWRDVGWWHLPLQPLPAEPKPPVALPDLPR